MDSSPRPQVNIAVKPENQGWKIKYITHILSRTKVSTKSYILLLRMKDLFEITMFVDRKAKLDKFVLT